MLNRVIIIGRLVKDPVIRYLPSGTQLAEFPLVYSRRYMVSDTWKEESHFFEVKAFGRLAESIASRVSKGYMVVVEGRLVQDRWQDKDGNMRSRIRILADGIRIINKPKMDEPAEEVELKEEEVLPEEPFEKPFSSEDDEIPF
ncbi:MAG: single-stranded DNA-binding protein [Aquificaceae bacterium]